MYGLNGVLTGKNNTTFTGKDGLTVLKSADNECSLYYTPHSGLTTLETDSHLFSYAGEIFGQDGQSGKDLLNQLAATGTKATIANLKGHFALAIFDKQSGQIDLVTDKFTTHPIYYVCSQDGFYFSSRLNDLLKLTPDKPQIDPQAIYQYLYFHCIPSPNTIYQNILKLEPGTRLTITDFQLAKSSSHIVPFSPSEHSLDQQKERLRATLESGVKRAMPGGDPKTTGAFLSGGLDSSSVAGYYAKLSEAGEANTFTIGFDADGYDETPFAKITADHFGTQHHVYYVTPDDVVDALPKIAAWYDEPFGNSSALPTYFCAKFAAQNGISTLLAGDGGDELFAGNERYVKQLDFEKYRRVPEPLYKYLVSPPAKLAHGLLNSGFTAKVNSFLTQVTTPLPERLHYYNFLHQLDPNTVFSGDVLVQIDQGRPENMLRERYQGAKDTDHLNKMLYLDWKFTLADNDLVKVNSMCQAAGVNVKFPMLDDEIADMSVTIDSDMKLYGEELRGFYKYAMQGFLSDKTLNKSKQGFGLPFGQWMKTNQDLQNMATENVMGLADTKLFKPEFLENVLKLHKEGHASYYGELVWILMMLNLWIKSHQQTT